MYRLIVVPLDGSALDARALSLATRIARAASCAMQLVHVQPLPALGTELQGAVVLDAARVGELRTDSERYVQRLADQVAAGSGVRAAPVVLDGTVPGALHRHVQESGADVVVMATHDRGALERLVLGSVAESVVRAVSVPVLLARAPADQPEAPPADELPPAIKHLLVPLDGSAFAEQVIPHAATLAKLMGAQVTLLGVVDPMLATASVAAGEEGARVVPLPGSDELSAYDDTALEHSARRLRADGLVVHVSVLADRQPAHAIVRYAEEHSVDVIAMTTHGRGALGRLVTGSVAHDVLHRTSSAMLLYRPTRKD